jgi:hypothetical protein
VLKSVNKNGTTASYIFPFFENINGRQALESMAHDAWSADRLAWIRPLLQLSLTRKYLTYVVILTYPSIQTVDAPSSSTSSCSHILPVVVLVRYFAYCTSYWWFNLIGLGQETNLQTTHNTKLVYGARPCAPVDSRTAKYNVCCVRYGVNNYISAKPNLTKL